MYKYINSAFKGLTRVPVSVSKGIMHCPWGVVCCGMYLSAFARQHFGEVHSSISPFFSSAWLLYFFHDHRQNNPVLRIFSAIYAEQWIAPEKKVFQHIYYCIIVWFPMWHYRGFTLTCFYSELALAWSRPLIMVKAKSQVLKTTVARSVTPDTLHTWSRGQLLWVLHHYPRAQPTFWAAKTAESWSSSLEKKILSEHSVNDRGNEWLSCCLAVIYHQRGPWPCYFVLIKALGDTGRPAFIYSGHVLA